MVIPVTNVYGRDLPPGQIDFGDFVPPEAGGEFVEVNVGTSLISLAARLVEKEDAETARLLDGLKLVRVNVVGLDEHNRADIQNRAQRIRKDLDSKGWERIVMARQQAQNVSVYLKSDPKEGVQGLALIVLDGKDQAVFVNVVGNIKPEQLSRLGEKLHLDPLKQIDRSMNKHGKAEAE